MSADVAARLRLLAQDHHDGRLDLAAYRALRAPLLDSLVLNTAVVASAMEITQPRAMVRAVSDDATTRPGKPGVAGPASVPHEGVAPASSDSGGPGTSKRFPVVAIVIGVAVVAVAIIAFWMLRGMSAGDRATQQVAAGAEDRVRELVDPFIERGDWGDGRLASLNASLLELGGSQIATVAREAWFQRFVDELRRRLKEQQALAATPLTVDNSPLAALAVTVGLDLDSPDSAIHIAAVPAPPPAEGTSIAAKAEKSGAHGPKAGATHEGADAHTAQANAHGPAQPTSVAGPSTDDPAHASAGADSKAGTSDSSGTDGAGSRGARAGSGAMTMVSVPSAGSRGTTSSAASAAVDAGENSCRVELIGSRRPLCHDMLPSGVEAPLLALVPAGAFEMGSTVTSEEQPVHRVTIREPFAISVYEVSQGDFRQFCERTNRTCTSQPWSGDDYPVVNVSWDEARAYTDWLTSVTHHRYSLPTEAQWEYAARAGQTGLFPGGDTLAPTDAHYSMVAKRTRAARRADKFKANAFRLVHVVGNVREWVEDGWVPNFSGAPSDGSAVKAAQAATHVARGGSYTDGAARLRLSMREGLPAGTRDTTTGFRIVRELP